MNEAALAAWMSTQGVLVSPERSQYTFGLYDINSDMQIEAWVRSSNSVLLVLLLLLPMSVCPARIG
jgi:hypothetical protein